MHRSSRSDLQDVALTGRQHFEDLVLDLLQAALVGSTSDDEVVLLLLQLGPLLGHHNPQQLLLQPLMRCHEGQQAHLKAKETKSMPFSLRQTALERQALSRTYLAHHELEGIIIIITIVIVFIIIVSCYCCLVIIIMISAIIMGASSVSSLGGSPEHDADKSIALTNTQAR